MMRGKTTSQSPAAGPTEIVVTVEPVEKGILGKLKWLNKPFLRGALALIDTMVLGMKSLMWAANIAMEDEQAARTKEKE